MNKNDISAIEKAVDLILKSQYTTVFTGAGVSVESGIPPFRGKSGLWSKYDPECLDIDRFYDNPHKSWPLIKEIFYDYFGKAKPNEAHKVIARLEDKGYVKSVITQNIDNLHQEAGSKNIFEFHGTAHQLICTSCRKVFKAAEVKLDRLPPLCTSCKAVLKPDFVFFGESIPSSAYNSSLQAAKNCDLMIIVGSTGEVMPACSLPYTAKQSGATIIEINPEKSNYTDQLTDLYFKCEAGNFFTEIAQLIFKNA